MPEVQMPDGSIATFPDEMPQDQIASAIQAHIKAQNANIPGVAQTEGMPGNTAVTPPEAPGAHAAKVAGSNMLAGALELAGMPGTILDALPKAPANPNAPAPSNPDETGIAQLAASGGALRLPTSNDLVSGAKGLGLVDQPSQQPRDWFEKMVAAGSRGFGGAAPLGLLSGGLGAIPAATLKAGIQGVASGVGGEIGREVLPISNNPTVSTLAGVLAGQGVGGGLYGGIARGANALRGVGNPIIDAYDLAGVTPRLAGDVTGKPILQALQATAMRAPFGGRAVRAAQDTASEFGNAVENTAATLGKAETLQQAGTELQNGAKDWLTQFKNNNRNVWNAVDAEIPANTPVGLQNYAQTLAAVRNQMPNAPATAARLDSPLTGGLMNDLISDIQRGPLTWQDVKGIRTRIGERLENPQLVSDTSQADLKRLYGALSNDMAQTAAAKGPQAQAAFDNATAVTRSGHDFIDATLSRILNGDKISPESAANAVLNAGNNGGTILGQIRSQMPNAADELAAYKLRDMAAATPGRATAEMPFSATTFSTEVNRLSPEARAALFGAVEPKVGALQTVAERSKETLARYGNPSGTAGALEHNAIWQAPLSIASGTAAGHALGGVPGAIGGATLNALPYAAGPVASNLTAREMLTRYLAAPVGGPGVAQSRLYRAAGAWPALMEGETAR